MNKKTGVRVLALLVIAAAIAASAWWYAGHRGDDETSGITLYGNVDIREVDLSFNNSEHIDQILVQEGDRVSKGQLLATMHRERILAEVAAAEARVTAQAAVLARLQAGSRPEEVQQARANVSAARARLDDADVTYNRTRQLFEKKLVPHQAVDDAQASLDTARADLRVAQEALTLAVKGPRTEDIDEAKAMLQADQAQLALAQVVLQDTELYAPADGIIRQRILEPGDMATPQTPVFTLALINPVWVRTYASETLLGRLAPGMTAAVSTDSYPGKTYRSWIGFISPTAEFTPKNVETPDLRTRLVYQLRVYVCNPEDELRLGMPATVSIPLDQVKPKSGQTVPACTKTGED